MQAIRLLSIILLSGVSAMAGSYSTSFSGTENPISESGQWINGLVTGLDWANVRKTPGLAFGTQTGNETHDNDSTALLTGSWGNSQTCTAVVVKSGSDTASAEEVELRLRSSLTSHSCTGYEVLFSTLAGNQYLQIVRWNGALDSFTLLDARPVGVANGDTIKATATGNVIAAFVNGTMIFSVTDSTYASGNPGMGFYFKLNGGSGSQSNFGFSSFTADDGQASSPVNTNSVSISGAVTISGKVKIGQ